MALMKDIADFGKWLKAQLALTASAIPRAAPSARGTQLAEQMRRVPAGYEGLITPPAVAPPPVEALPSIGVVPPMRPMETGVAPDIAPAEGGIAPDIRQLGPRPGYPRQCNRRCREARDVLPRSTLFPPCFNPAPHIVI